jgi:translation initiation factor 1 (eIF-1/SUI1)
MAKPKTRIPLGNTTEKNFSNPFATLANVQATNTSAPPAVDTPAEHEHAKPAARKIGKFAVQAERKGRGGKTVTMVRNLGLNDDAMQSLAKDMRQALGCGAVVEADCLVLQGDQTERARAYLKKLRET